jgi:hypothetical protein
VEGNPLRNSDPLGLFPSLPGGPDAAGLRIPWGASFNVGVNVAGHGWIGGSIEFGGGYDPARRVICCYVQSCMTAGPGAAFGISIAAGGALGGMSSGTSRSRGLFFAQGVGAIASGQYTIGNDGIAASGSSGGGAKGKGGVGAGSAGGAIECIQRTWCMQ